MRKEIGKWFLDISKFVTTGVLITPFFSGKEVVSVYWLGGVIACLCFTAGLLFIKEWR
jgi:hypothetical protein